jgi:hypothetical protein
MTLQENSRRESSSSSQPAPLSQMSRIQSSGVGQREVSVLDEYVAAFLNATKRFRGQTGGELRLVSGFGLPRCRRRCLPRSCLCSIQRSTFHVPRDLRLPRLPTSVSRRFPRRWCSRSLKREKSLTHHQTRYQGPQSGDKWPRLLSQIIVNLFLEGFVEASRRLGGL